MSVPYACSLLKVKCVRILSATKERQKCVLLGSSPVACLHHISTSLCPLWIPQICKWHMAKKSPPMALNGLRLLALTSLLMKLMEKLIKKETVLQVEEFFWIPFNLDQERCGGCCHTPAEFSCTHIWRAERLVPNFSDFSSAFKTLRPRAMRRCRVSLETEISWDG